MSFTLFPNLGAVRALVIALRLDTSGVDRGIAQMQAKAGAISVMTRQMDRDLNMVNAQMSLIGFAGAAMIATATNRWMQFERTIKQAELAGRDAGSTFAGLSEDAFDLSEKFGRSPQDMAELVKQIQFMGIHQRDLNAALSESAVELSLVGDIAEKDAAKSIAKIAQLTARSNGEFHDFLRNSRLIASQLAIVGTNIAADTPALVAFMEQFKLLGVASKFSTGELIALGGALAHVDDKRRDIMTTAMFRILSLDAAEAQELVAALGLTNAEFERMQVTAPIQLLQRLIDFLSDARDQEMNIATLSRSMGIADLRNVKAIESLVGAGDKLRENLEAVRKEQQRASAGEMLEIQMRSNEILRTSSARWEALKAALMEFGITLGGILSDVLLPFIKALTGLFQSLAQHKALMTTFALGLTAITGLAGFTVAKNFLGGGPLGMLLGGARAGAGRAFGGMAQGMALRSMLFGGAKGIPGAIVEGFKFLSARAKGGLGFLSGMFGGAPGARLFQTLMHPGAGRIGASLFGMVAGAPLRFLAGPVGMVLTALELLAPAFEHLGAMFEDIGQQGGALGFVAKLLALVFKSLSLVGNGIGKLWEMIVGGFKWLWDQLKSIPIIGDAIRVAEQVGAGINKVLDSAIEEVDKANEALKNQRTDAPQTNAGDASVGQTISTTINVGNVGDTGAATRMAERVAISAAFSISPTAIRVYKAGS